jgi:predicted DNA-binding transcriptional regulator AlpA
MTDTSDHILRLNTVLDRTGWRESAVNKWMRKPQFREALGQAPE